MNKFFLGTFSINTVKKNIPVNHGLICNTDVDLGPGIHWFSLFRSSKKIIECFDPLGVSNEKLDILASIKFRGVQKLKFNETQIQPNRSTSCGQFAIYFLFERFNNLDLKFHELVNEIFNDNLDNNEMTVEKFFEEFKNGAFN
jgi:hypothetical protein